jgi:probable addiction module antidote protein
MSHPRQGREIAEYVREFIQHPQSAAEYLNAAREDGDQAAFLIALRDVLDVHGSLSELARQAGVNRPHLHRILQGKTSPRLDTLSRVLNTVGLEIRIRPVKRGGTSGKRKAGASRTGTGRARRRA